MNYTPATPPTDPKQLSEYLARELARFAASVRDDTAVVQYRTSPANQGSLTAAVSANFKIAAGNVVRISTSATVTLTGFANTAPNRELVLVNVGTGVVVLKHDGTESSASYRVLLAPESALSVNWNLSANASAILWYDAYSSRWRGISRT